MTARHRVWAAAAILAPVVTFPLGVALGHPWLLPVLNTLPAYAALVWLLRAGRRATAIAVVLAWAVVLAVSGTVTLAWWPSPPDAVVLAGPAYRDEMFEWIRTGEGREGDWRAFLPQHAGHLLAFAVLSLATASALSLFMGSVLMGYMAFYVASLARAGVAPSTVLLFGWQPWAIFRIVGFCVLGVVLAEPLVARLRGARWEGFGAARGWLWLAAGCIAADWLLKTALAPVWGRILRQAMP